MSSIQTINPATEELVATFASLTSAEIETKVAAAAAAFDSWRRTSIDRRQVLVGQLGKYFQTHRTRLAELITLEMGKPISQALAEIDKCAVTCDYVAAHGAEYFVARTGSIAGAATSIRFEPIGIVLAIMPWNFPFWQVIRPGIAAILAGNTVLLKHAPNVPQCALALETALLECGFPPGILTTLLIDTHPIGRLLADSRIQAVTLTGSERAGAAVAELAGRNIKTSVLELGGSDPFIVLADADVAKAAQLAVKSRAQNAGQSCIAAKRFIVAESIVEDFTARLASGMSGLKVGDPTQQSTDMGPLARRDLVEAIDRQVRESIVGGAKLVCGGRRSSATGFFFEPTILTNLSFDSPVRCEETFGPVAAVMPFREIGEAIALANESRYGLGATICTSNTAIAEQLAQHIEAGMVYVNAIVASDVRLPFGGIKKSGYGRELGDFGFLEFVNIKTLFVARS